MEKQFEKPMKWYKFVIYFQLFAAAVFNVGAGIIFFTGSHYGLDSFELKLFYGVLSNLKTLDICMGIVSIFLAVFANAVVFPVQLKYGSSTGRLVLLVLVFGIMAVGWIGVELCQKMKVDFSGLKNLGLRIWNLGIPVCLAMLFVLMLLMFLISCTISIKIMEKKEY